MRVWKSDIKGYLLRLLICSAGLALYGFSNTIGIKAGGAGTNAWSTLALGISGKSGLSFGTATFLVSLLIILIDIFGKGQLGLGTVLNIVLIPVFSDLFLLLFTGIPPVSNVIAGTAVSLIGQTLCSFATIFYMMPELGCGPRDTLMVLVGKRFPRVPIGVIKFCVEITALLIGVLLGAPFGPGTVLIMVLQAAIFQAVCRILRFEPRDITHEVFAETFRNLTHRA